MTKKIKSCIILLAAMAALSGCAEKQVPSESANVVSLAEEIAAGVSEDVIPDEAYHYSKLNFEVPAGMVEDPENTEDLASYFSSDVDDLSFIQYRKTLRDSKADYSAITEETYKTSLQTQLGYEVTIDSFNRESKEGYDEISVQFRYYASEVPYSLKSYIFVTDEYVFCIDYSLAGTTTLADAFTASQASLKLESIVDSMPVNE